MGQLAWISVYVLVVLPIDVNDNRRHVHIFRRQQRKQKCVAKIWIESNGEKNIEIAYSELSTKENDKIIITIDKNWNYINDRISDIFNGKKIITKELK